MTPASVLIDTHCGFIFNVFCESSSEQRISAKCNLCDKIQYLWSVHSFPCIGKKTHKKKQWVNILSPFGQTPESTTFSAAQARSALQPETSDRHAVFICSEVVGGDEYCWQYSPVGSTRLLAVFACWQYSLVGGDVVFARRTLGEKINPVRNRVIRTTSCLETGRSYCSPLTFKPRVDVWWPTGYYLFIELKIKCLWCVYVKKVMPF